MFGVFTTERHYIKNLLNLDNAKILTRNFTMFGELYWPLSCVIYAKPWVHIGMWIKLEQVGRINGRWIRYL